MTENKIQLQEEKEDIINKIINFKEFFSPNKEPDEEQNNKSKMKYNIFILYTKLTNNTIEYSKFERITNSDEFNKSEFINRIHDSEIIPRNLDLFNNWLKKENDLLETNKRIGSRQGLNNSVPYVCIVGDKIYGNFEEKAKKMKEGLLKRKDIQSSQGLVKELPSITDSLSEVYCSFLKDPKFSKKKSNENEGDNENEGYNHSRLFILLPEEIGGGCKRDKIYETFHNTQENYGKTKKEEYNSIEEMVCPVCKQEKILTVVGNDVYSDKKIFLKHTGRGDDGFSFRACVDCGNKYKKALEYLGENFSILPLFSKNDIKLNNDKGIAFGNNNGKKVTFKDVFDKLKKYYGSTYRDKYRFHIIAVNKIKGTTTLRLFDYVNNYDTQLNPNNYDTQLNPNIKPPYDTYDRFDAEKDIWHILTGGNKLPYYLLYFASELEKDRQFKDDKWRIANVYKLRDSIFNFVYRGENSINKRMINEIADEAIRHEILKHNLGIEMNCREILKETKKLFNAINWDNMTNEIDEKDIDNAKKLGEAFRVIIDFSEAGNDKHNLLSPALHKPNIYDVTRIFSKLLDKYYYRFGDLNEVDQKLIRDALNAQYKTNKFESLKMYFYAGYFNRVKK